MFHIERTVWRLPTRGWLGSRDFLICFLGNIYRLPVVLGRPEEDQQAACRTDGGQVFDIERAIRSLPAGGSASHLSACNLRYIIYIPIMNRRPRIHQQITAWVFSSQSFCYDGRTLGQDPSAKRQRERQKSEPDGCDWDMHWASLFFLESSTKPRTTSSRVKHA